MLSQKNRKELTELNLPWTIIPTVEKIWEQEADVSPSIARKIFIMFGAPAIAVTLVLAYFYEPVKPFVNVVVAILWALMLMAVVVMVITLIAAYHVKSASYKEGEEGRRKCLLSKGMLTAYWKEASTLSKVRGIIIVIVTFVFLALSGAILTAFVYLVITFIVKQSSNRMRSVIREYVNNLATEMASGEQRSMKPAQARIIE